MTELQTVTSSQANKETPFMENFESLSAAGIFSKRHPVTAGLVWGYYGGLYNGNTIANGTVTLTNAATNYVVVLRSSGFVSTSTSSANSLNPAYAKLYEITTAGGVVTNPTTCDRRWDANGLFFSGGSTTSANIPAQRYVVELLNTTDSDPGAGLIKFNNATPASATALYIDDSTSDGVDLSTYFAGLGATGYITIQSTSDAGEWAIFKWTAITDQTGYFRFTVTPYASLGTLDDADAVVVAFDSDVAGGGGMATDTLWNAAGDLAYGTGSDTATRLATGTARQKLRVNSGATAPEWVADVQCIAIACGDETTALTTGTGKVTFRMPYAFTLTDVRSSVTTAPTGGTLLTVDVNEAGSTILSTKLTFDASEKTTTTAATPRVISDTALADDAEITIDIDAVGSTIAGAGLKVYLIGVPT